MLFDPFDSDALVEVVVGFARSPRETAGEADTAFPEAAPLLSPLGLTRVQVAAARLADLRHAADALFEVFAAEEAAERSKLIDAALARTGVRPAMAEGEPPARWWVASPRDVPLAAGALALRRQAERGGLDRLGTCAGDRCIDAFVDSSPAGDRRFCSITCQTRARVRAHRARRREVG